MGLMAGESNGRGMAWKYVKQLGFLDYKELIAGLQNGYKLTLDFTGDLGLSRV